MTLVLAVFGRDTMWSLTDRRLSYKGLPPRDDAIKVTELETLDGRGLLAYSGLGATAQNMQPSEWMSAVLRGRAGLSFVESLGILATVATRELPRHLQMTPAGTHCIVVPAWLKGSGRRMFVIGHQIQPGTRLHTYGFHDVRRDGSPDSPAPTFALAGSGGAFLARQGDWSRQLFSLVKAHDRGKVSDHVVSDFLARLNVRAHQNVETVGPKSLVIWRRRPDSRLPTGSAHQYYDGADRAADEHKLIPFIGNGLDVAAVVSAVWSNVLTRQRAGTFGQALTAVAEAELDSEVAKIPSDPDEQLR